MKVSVALVGDEVSVDYVSHDVCTGSIDPVSEERRDFV